MAGLLDAHRNPKDWGGLDPKDVNADTVLVLDLVPRPAGADLALPTGPLALQVHVSHHGPRPVQVRLSAAWTVAGRPFPPDASLPAQGVIESKPMDVMPFALTAPGRLNVPGVSTASRLLLWATDERHRVVARAFLDAAEVEPPNRRGSRLSG